MKKPGLMTAWMRVAALIAIGLVTAAEASAWQALTGRVTAAADGAGFADVEIRAQLTAPTTVLAALGKSQPFVVGRSDADGNFRIDLPREAGPIGWERVDALVLFFVRDGVRSHAEHLVRAQIARPIQIRLDRVAGEDRLSETQRQKLEALRVAGSPAIFIAPYALRGPTAGAGEELAEQLRVALLRMIRRHLSSFTLATPLPEIALRSLDAKQLELDDTITPAALAASLDALAVIGGRIETGATRGRIVVVSEFVLRGSSARLPAVYRVEDSVSADPAQALAELERILAPRWARLAVLSLVASELRVAMAANDAQRLRSVQQFVAQELRRAGRGNVELVPQAQALQQDAETALRRLGYR